MQRVEPKQTFRRGDPVIYNGTLMYWGAKAGSRRTLSINPNSAGILVAESEVGVSIFPAPKNRVYNINQAVRWEYPGARTARACIYVLQVGPGSWIGGLSAAFGTVTRSIPMHEGSEIFDSERAVVVRLLHVLFEALQQYAEHGKRPQKVAKETQESILASLLPDYLEAFKPRGVVLQ